MCGFFGPAIEIIRVFEFQMLNLSSNTVSNLFFLLPLSIAWEVLRGEQAWEDWIRHTLKVNFVDKTAAMKDFWAESILRKVHGTAQVSVGVNLHRQSLSKPEDS
jgi:hypothetical protein